MFWFIRKSVCLYPDRQTELVDVRRGKRNTLRQANKESGEIKEQGEEEGNRQRKEGNTEDISDRGRACDERKEGSER